MVGSDVLFLERFGVCQAGWHVCHVFRHPNPNPNPNHNPNPNWNVSVFGRPVGMCVTSSTVDIVLDDFT
eukprot:612229-Amorphochlora_amoeboformis.AAC.1